MAIAPLNRTPAALAASHSAVPASVAHARTAPPPGDSIERSSLTTVPKMSPPHGLGVGLLGGAAAEAGVGFGAGATVSAGAGLFYDGSNGVRPGAYAAGGAFAGGGDHAAALPRSTQPAGAVGAFLGAGVGAFVTNATSAKQLAGIAQTYSLNAGVGPLKFSVQVGASDGKYVGSLSIGPGIGLDVSRYPTQTVSIP